MPTFEWVGQQICIAFAFVAQSNLNNKNQSRLKWAFTQGEG